MFLHSLSGGADSLDSIIEPRHRVAKIRFLVNDDSSALGEKLIAIAQDEVGRVFPEGYTVRYSGTLASTVAATDVMVEGKMANILQVAILTAVIAGVLMRSVLAGLLVCVPLAMSVAVTFGAMAALGIPLDTLTAAIAAMAVGIGADYAMYLLFRVREEAAKHARLEDAVAIALVTSGKAVLFVASAIAAGYSTLAFSGFSVHVHLGLLVALSMAVSALSTLLILPSVLLYWQPGFVRRGVTAFEVSRRNDAVTVVGERAGLGGVRP
jgi:predicted RND superfamily exporter protein